MKQLITTKTKNALKGLPKPIRRVVFKSTIALSLLFGMNSANAQVDVTATGGTLSQSYTTLKGAFDAINLGTHTGVITLGISANTTESAAAALNASGSGAASYTSVAIIPTGGAARTISGSFTGHLVDLNGADNVTIDGLNTGSNTLTISSTGTGVSGAIRFIGDASSNIIQNVTLTGAGNSASTGVVFFSTGTTTGNDNNMITNCSINAGGAGFIGIYASGSASPADNSGNTISNNNIYDFTAATALSAGIYVTSGNTDWTLTGNSLYQTATRTSTAATTPYGIYISNTSGNNFVVTGNYIGGGASSCGGTAWTAAGSFSNRFVGIYLSVGTTTASSVQNNTIANYVWGSTSGATTLPGVWAGIYLLSGNANIGTVTGNTIGSGTGTNSVQCTISTSGGVSVGIGCASTGTVSISNNKIGSINLKGSTTSVNQSFNGIWTTGAAASMTINNDTIGSATTANSITFSTAGTTATASVLQGILNSGGATTISITNNMVANLSSAYVPGTANANSIVRGIVSTSGTNTISGNTVRNLSAAANGSGSGVAGVVIGILCSSATSGSLVSQNTVSALTSTHATLNSRIIGIAYTGATTGTNTVERNLVYDIDVASTSCQILGIDMIGGTTTYQNNIIRLGTFGNSATLATTVIGFNENAGTPTNNLYYNTVSIGGTTSAAVNSFGLNNNITPAAARVISNNIFYNARSSSGTGNQYAARLTNVTNTTINYNDYFVPGTLGAVGLFGGVLKTDLTAWKTSTTQDANSVSLNPAFTSSTNLIPQSCTLNDKGVVVATVSNDYAAGSRSGTTPDIGAYEYTPSVLSAPTVSSPARYCQNTPASPLTATGTYTLLWFTASSGGVGVTTLPPDVTTAGTTTYYVADSNTASGCISARTSLVVDVIPEVTNNTISGAQSICSTDIPTTLTGVLPTGGDTSAYGYTWMSSTTDSLSGFITASGTHNTQDYSPAALAQTTWYKRVVTSGICAWDTSATVKVGVTATPTIVSSNGSSVCDSGAVTLSATASAGTLNWYDAASLGILVGSGTSFVTPTISTTTTYYVQADTNTCSSPRTAVVATIKHGSTSGQITTVCDSIVWNGTTYTTSGVYTYTTPNAVGCDSVVTLNLTVNHSSASTSNITACDSLVWNGTTYTTSGTYTYTTTNAVGCDSVATLNLTINHATTSTNNITACDSLVWNGTKYTTSGMYTYTTTNAVGCDSVAILNLTINHSTTSSSNITACNSLVWNGTTYTTSGTYSYTTTNAEGCDSVATLNLTINHSTTSTSNITACDSLVWNGTTYTAGGTYTYTTTNAVGCDSVATLNLTINHPTTSSSNITACNSLVWNGTTYTTSGTYTYTTTNTVGCDSVATLNLTINHPTTSSSNITACNSLVWNGTTYTTSGTYTYTTTNAVGCDSVATLNLTINTTIANNTVSGVQTICAGSTPTQLTGSTPTGGDGLSYTYEWFSSTTSSSTGFSAIASSNTQNYTPSALATTTWFKRVVTSGVCATDTSVVVEVTVNAAGTWTGAAGSDWNNTANWSCPSLPTSATNVIIPFAGVSNMPIVTDAQQVADLTILTGATLTLNASTSQLSIFGNITNNGTFSNTDGKIVMAGTSAQTLPAGTYAKLQINNSANVNLGGAVVLTDSLILTNGKLNLGSNNLTLGNNAYASQGSTSSYIATNGIGGRLIAQNIGSTGKTGAVVLPIGNSTFNPAVITNLGTTDAYTIWMRDSLVDYTTGNVVASNGINRAWEIDEATAGGSNVTLTLQWSAVNELPGFVRSSSYIARYDGTVWVNSPALAASGSDPYTQTLAGITTFSTFANHPFAIGSGGILPVKMLSFTATKQKEAVKLNWVTASEINNSHFVVQRSVDGIVFENIATVKGNGTTSKVSTYSYNDVKAASLKGVVYYRLQQVDFDNRSNYSNVVTVDLGAITQTLNVTVSPNPFTDITSVNVTTPVISQSVLKITDMQGRLVLEKAINLEAGVNTVVLDELAASAYSGIYFVQIVTPTESIVTRIVKAK